MSNLSPDQRALIAATLTGRNRTTDLLEKSATQHGQDDEPDHEVGDLQEFLRAAVSLLTDDQRSRLYAKPEVRAVLAVGLNLEVEELAQIAGETGPA